MQFNESGPGKKYSGTEPVLPLSWCLSQANMTQDRKAIPPFSCRDAQPSILLMGSLSACHFDIDSVRRQHLPEPVLLPNRQYSQLQHEVNNNFYSSSLVVRALAQVLLCFKRFEHTSPTGWQLAPTTKVWEKASFMSSHWGLPTGSLEEGSHERTRESLTSCWLALPCSYVQWCLGFLSTT